MSVRARTPSIGQVPLDQASVLPAAFAAAAEAGVIWVLAAALAKDSSGITSGPLVSYPPFLAVFVGATALATALRRHAATRVAVPAAAIVGGVLEGMVGGAGDLSAVVAGILVSMGVAVRVVALAVRDWRAPASASFGIGAAVLLAEMALAPAERFDRELPTIVALFFAATMASRAASVWLANLPPPGSDLPPVARRFRNPAVLVAALVALMAVSFLLAVPGGAFQISGAIVWGVVAEVLVLLGLALSRILLPPLGWLVETFHISFQPIREAAEALSKVKGANNEAGGHTFAIERLLGLAFLAVVGFLLFRSIRRRWRMLEPVPDEDEEPSGPQPTRMMVAGRSRASRRRPRRELPAQTVRRWYAEALIALEGLGLPKGPSQTPGEYLRRVTGAFPASAIGFTALTRAYEDVRYGSRAIEGEALDRLEVHQRMAMNALSRAEPLKDRSGTGTSSP